MVMSVRLDCGNWREELEGKGGNEDMGSHDGVKCCLTEIQYKIITYIKKSTEGETKTDEEATFVSFSAMNLSAFS